MMKTVADPVIEFDRERDCLSIDGFKFAREFLTHITASEPGIRFRIISRSDGAITFSQEQSALEAAAPALLSALQAVLDRDNYEIGLCDGDCGAPGESHPYATSELRTAMGAAEIAIAEATRS